MTANASGPAVLHNGREGAQGDLLPVVRQGLLSAAVAARAEGMPVFQLHGQLIRPLVCMATLRHGEAPPEGFWDAALAIQLAHEASLVHDDIVDGAATRRGAPTLVADGGVARALIEGDHLLTMAYRAAARTGCPAFMQLFARAVERTVAGEMLQGKARGEVLEWCRYSEIAKAKSGELLGCALAAAPALEGREDTGAIFELGRRVGLLYQMLDDLLDYCPSANTGKPPLRDYEQRRWTWVLEEVPGLAFVTEAADVLAALHAPGDHGRGGPPDSPMQRALARLTEAASELRREAGVLIPEDPVMEPIQAAWLRRARSAVAAEAHGSRHGPARGFVPASDPAALEAALRSRIPALSGAKEYMARHSRSFRFASRLFPAADAARVAGIYAYCRITDDLVDRPVEGVEADALLVAWARLSRRAYDGEVSGFPLLDTVMREMAGSGVPFSYATELAEGMRMDLRGERYTDLPALREYTYRVAAVVGLWLTRMFGVHDPWMLERAERLGHAMQLTNILRDVGEDLGRGRVYLPTALLRKHGLGEADLGRMQETGAIESGYRALLEELMGVAEADYDAALEALPALPPSFGRPVAVAAHVYRGIHQEIRRRGYDNLRQRAYAGRLAKGVLAARGLWELYVGRGPASSATSFPVVVSRRDEE